MPNKEFLENYPLYKEMKIDLIFAGDGWNNKYTLLNPSINFECPRCHSKQTYNMIDEFPRENKEKIIATTHHIQYLCDGCKEEKIDFLIKIIDANSKNYSKVIIQKIGQYPGWSIKTNKTIDKMLGDYHDFYKKGLICESQSYGIGAYAYYRRIAENIIDELLNSIYDLIEGDKVKEEYKKALENVKNTKIAEKKIELVQDLLPQSLKLNGINPLKTLHSALSDGLHAKSDNECMDNATIIKNILVYLVGQIIRTKEEKKIFTDNMKTLLEKYNKKR